MRTGFPRHPGDVVRVGLAVAVIAITAAFVYRDRVTVLESDVFRVANDLPGWIFPVLWLVMQLGNFVAVPLVAAVAALTRRFRLAAEIALTGSGVWLLAKEVKKLVVRGRPDQFLGGVHIHGAAATGLGYPSGHAAVVAAMVTLVIPYLGRGWRRALASCIVVVCVARIYVGAHLPLDVVAGAALGWGVASAVHLILGAPSGKPRATDLRRSLTDLGLPPVSVRALGLDARRAALFTVVADGGDRLFVKVIPRERRDWDWPYRTWVWLRRLGRGQVPRSPLEAVEREGLMTMLAAQAGVMTAGVRAVGAPRHGAGVLVQEWIDGKALDVALAERDPAARVRILGDVWRQVSALQRGRIAHGALTGQHFLIDDRHEVHVVGFGRARKATYDLDLLAEVADALRLTSALAGAEAAVGTGCPEMGRDTLVAAVDLLEARERGWRARLAHRSRLDHRGAADLHAVRCAVEALSEMEVGRPG